MSWIVWYIIKYIYFFTIVFALIVIENRLEMKYKFAKRIHKFHLKSKFLSFVFGGKELNGYFIGSIIGLFLFLHIPFLITASWSIGAEAEIFSVLILMSIFWDFLWVVLSPYYGISKFNSKNLYWYENWIAFLPIEYIRSFGFALMITLIDYPFGIGKIVTLFLVFGIASLIIIVINELFSKLSINREIEA